MRHTRAHTKNRRSHHALTGPTLVACTQCGEPHRPHHMCLACGYYKGRQVIDMTAKRQAREARLQAKRERIRGQAAQDDAHAPDSAPQGSTTATDTR